MSFYNISRAEMEEFLFGQKFIQMNLPNTVELVYGKIVHVGQHRLSLRIYTAINPTGESRQIGKDAIRVGLYWLYEGLPTPVGKSQKCLRVDNWRKNLKLAIDAHSSSDNFKICDKCGSPMVIRQNARTKEKFWSCATWLKTKCPGRPMETPARGE